MRYPNAPQRGDAILDDDNVIRMQSDVEQYLDLDGITRHEGLLRALAAVSAKPWFETS